MLPRMSIDATVAIIGAGPLGLELAVALKQSGISYLQFDKGQVAQAIYNFPIQTPFFSSSERIGIAGIPIQTIDQQKCTREAYLAYIRSVCMKYSLSFHTYEEVKEIKKEKAFTVVTQKRTYCVQYVVLATGGTSTPRLLEVPGENLPHISTKMEDPHRYFGTKVAIIGGKNSAVESALRCFHAGADVSLIVRGAGFDAKSVKYWLLPELLGRVKRNEIKCFYQSEVQEIQEKQVILKDEKIVAADFVIKAIGFEANMELFRQLKVPLKGESKTPEHDPETMETAVFGLYVLGTIIGGTQKSYKVYIENTHHHVGKIMTDLAKKLSITLPNRCWYSTSYHQSGPLEE